MRTLFTISGILRVVIILILLRTISEVRRVPKIGTFRLLAGRVNTGKK
jgi:hypothetical protein